VLKGSLEIICDSSIKLRCAVKALTFVDYDNLTPEQKALVDKSVALNEAAGTKPKVRYIASHMDIAGRQEKMY